MLTLQEAVQYLQKRGVKASRQAVHAYIMQDENKKKCEQIGGKDGKKVALWFIPPSLLNNYQPSKQHQEAGIQRAEAQKAQ